MANLNGTNGADTITGTMAARGGESAGAWER